MPWLSIIMALVTFFLAGGAKPENRAKAAALGLGAGAATYGITHYTDWGSDTLGQWDGVEFEYDEDGNVISGRTPDDTVIKPTLNPPTQTGSTGFWSTLGGFLSSGAGQLAAVTGISALAGVPMWAVLAVVGLGIYLISKD